jgi:hypothetical protein
MPHMTKKARVSKKLAPAAVETVAPKSAPKVALSKTVSLVGTVLQITPAYLQMKIGDVTAWLLKSSASFGSATAGEDLLVEMPRRLARRKGWAA